MKTAERTTSGCNRSPASTPSRWMTVMPPEPMDAARRRGATNHKLTMQPETTAAQIHAAERPHKNAAAATVISIHAFTALAA